MTSLARRPVGALIPDLWDMFETSWPFSSRHPMHIEDFVEEGAYVVRAELPGLDATKDIDVSAANGVLTITAKREETTKEQHRVPLRLVHPCRHAAHRSGRGEDLREVREGDPGGAHSTGGGAGGTQDRDRCPARMS
ncbi:Hsp20/alpha crystallin family protein [Lentzea terrae]